MLPNQRGFDHFYGHITGGIGFWDKVHGGGYDWQRNGKTVRDGRYATHLIALEAIDLLEERDASRPFFLVASFNAPHLPNEAPEASINTYTDIDDPDRRIHAAMVTEFDLALGQIIKTLKSMDVYENTIIWFMSDNGGLIKRSVPDTSWAMVGRDGKPLAPDADRPEWFLDFVEVNATQGGSSNYPLQRGKGSVYEGGIRVPSLVSWPAKISPSGHTSMFTVEDVLPTLLAMAQISDTSMEDDVLGTDLSRVLMHRDTINGHPYIALGNDGLTYIDWPWKLIAPPKGDPYLFNVEQDPREQQNLAASETQQVKSMQTALAAFPRGEVITPLALEPSFIWDPDYFGGSEDRPPWADVVQP
jgi:arylsulfatase A-like enzyme